jgi:hypothetical protein
LNLEYKVHSFSFSFSRFLSGNTGFIIVSFFDSCFFFVTPIQSITNSKSHHLNLMDNGTRMVSLPEAQDLEHVRTVTEKCQPIIDQVSLGFIPRAQFLKWIGKSGETVTEAEDYLAQLTQRLCQPVVSA